MEPVDDAGIVAELRSDRTHGFSLLYDAYAERLFAYAITVTRDRETAADVTHNAMIRAVDGIQKLRDPDLLRPWLFRITRNEAISSLRRGNKWSDDESAIEQLASEPDFDQNLKAEDAQRLVSAAMAGLSPVDRDVLSLALRKDLSTQDVATAMGTTTNQASARLSRAKNALTNAVTAVVLTREADTNCSGLAEAMSGHEGTLNPLTRKRINRHVRDCRSCATTGRRRARQYVAGFTVPVTVLVSAGFLDEAQAALASEIGALGSTDEAGFPTPQDVEGAAELPPVVTEGAFSDPIPATQDPRDLTLDTLFLGTAEQPTEVLQEPAEVRSRAGWLLAGAGALVLLLLVGTGVAIQQATNDEAPRAATENEVADELTGSTTGAVNTRGSQKREKDKQQSRKSSRQTSSPTPSTTSSSRPRTSSSPQPSASATPSTSTKPSSSRTPTPSTSTSSPAPSATQVTKPTPRPTTPSAKPTPKPSATYRTPSYSPKPTQSTAPSYSPKPTYSAPAPPSYSPKPTTPKATNSNSAGPSASKS